MTLFRDVFLQSAGNHARADALGEEERIAGPCSLVGPDATRIDQAGDSVAELDLIFSDAVAAKNDAAGLAHFLGASVQDSFEDLNIGIGWEYDERKSGNGPAAHGIDIAQRVGRGDGAESVWIVDNRREKIDRLHHGKRFPAGLRQVVDTGVIGRFITYQDLVVGDAWYRPKRAIENFRAELGCAAAGFYGCGEFCRHANTSLIRRSARLPLGIAIRSTRRAVESIGRAR